VNGFRLIPVQIDSWNRKLACSAYACILLCLSGCFLTSSKPILQKKAVSAWDLAISRDLVSILAESSELVKDFNRLVSFSLGAVLPEGAKIETLGDFAEYTSIFDPIDTDFRDVQVLEGTRFSEEIWNESIYLLQKRNPKFRLRAEGRLSGDAQNQKIESLALVIDTESEISNANSEAILSAREKCLNETCETTIRIDQKGIASILGKAMKSSSWLGTVGTIVGKVLKDKTIGKVESLVFVSEGAALKITAINYVRLKSENSSVVSAAGLIQMAGKPDLNFTIEGNLRDPKSLKVSFLKDTDGEPK